MSELLTNFDAIIDDEKEGIAKVEQPVIITRGTGNIQGIINTKKEDIGTFEWYNIDKLLTFKLTSCDAENINYSEIKLASKIDFPAVSNLTTLTTVRYDSKSRSTIPLVFNCQVTNNTIDILFNENKINSSIIRAILYRWFIIQLN